MRRDIPLPAWRPDGANTSGASLEVADNVLPFADGFAPVPQFVALPGSALPGYPLGGASMINSSRLTTTFAGTATNLYTYSAAGWASVGSGYAATDDNSWAFQQFGQWVIASNGADAPVYYDLSGAEAFVALPGTEGVAPPRMKVLGVVKDFFVGGYCEGNALRVQWSGINNVTEWRPAVGQSDFNIFPDGGDVTAIASGEYGLVFQSDSVRRMDYVGGDTIFAFNVISPNVGCVHPRAFAQVGRLSFFLSARGFMICDGNAVTPIGDEVVDRTFQSAAAVSYYGRMSCVADPVRKIVYWSVPAAEPNTWFAYHWALQRWSRVRMSARLLLPGRSRDISLDEEFGSPDALWDEGLSFDDPAYFGGAPTFYVFNASNAIGALTGSPSAATLTLGPVALAGMGSKVALRRMRLDSDAVTGVTIAVDGRQRVGDAASVTTHSGPMASGDIVTRRRARTVALSFTIAAGTAWTFFNAFSVEYEQAGAR